MRERLKLVGQPGADKRQAPGGERVGHQSLQGAQQPVQPFHHQWQGVEYAEIVEDGLKVRHLDGQTGWES